MEFSVAALGNISAALTLEVTGDVVCPDLLERTPAAPLAIRCGRPPTSHKYEAGQREGRWTFF